MPEEKTAEVFLMAIVEFKNVSRVYKSGDHELKALDGVNMSLEEGKFVRTQWRGKEHALKPSRRA